MSLGPSAPQMKPVAAPVPDTPDPDPDPVSVAILREQDEDKGAVDALVMAAFGPGRFAKTAERIREQSRLTAGFTVYEDDMLLGSVRLWSVMSGQAKGAFLGPIAVAKTNRSAGLGGHLVRRCIEEARAQGLDGILLIGDPPYFERFGFQPAPKSIFPGPVNPRRVMWLPFTGVSPEGAVVPVA